MPFKKGQSGNPGGKVKSNYRKMMDDALAADTRQHRGNLIKYAVAQARKDNTVLSAILKKLLPDLKSIEAKIDSDSPFRLILEYRPTDKADKQSINRDNGNKPTHTGSHIISSKCTNPKGHNWQPDNVIKDGWRCEWCHRIAAVSYDNNEPTSSATSQAPAKTNKPKTTTPRGDKH